MFTVCRGRELPLSVAVSDRVYLEPSLNRSIAARGIWPLAETRTGCCRCR